MKQIIHLNDNPCDGDSSEFNDYNFSVTDYEQGDYDWSWEAWSENDWYFYKFYLWHCSCYWPFENRPPAKFTEEEALKLMPNNIKDTFISNWYFIWVE